MVNEGGLRPFLRRYAPRGVRDLVRNVRHTLRRARGRDLCSARLSLYTRFVTNCSLITCTANAAPQ